MKQLSVITPVKDSIELTLKTIEAIMTSHCPIPFSYTVYNDFSTPENTLKLEEASKRWNFRLVNLSDLTNHPSPNYLLVLQMAQKEALANDAGLLIVESDVVVRPTTLHSLYAAATELEDCGMVASVTVDEQGNINFPYLYAKRRPMQAFATIKRFSFCCTLLHPRFLEAYSFEQLDPTKHWFDVTISHASVHLGFKNYLFTLFPVLHRPHSSRPWKLLKYSNPLKYYWIKYTKGFDKI